MREIPVDKNYRDSIISLLVFIFLSLFLQGQSYLGRYYTEEDGLPSSAVEDAVQDRLGRMWFAGRSGITVYDGIHWQTFTPEHGLPIRSYLKIRIDNRGTVWGLSDYVGTHMLFISKLDASHRHLTGPGVRWETFSGLTCSIRTRPLITAYELFEPSGNIGPIVLVAARDNGLFLVENGRKRNLTREDGLPDNTINGLAVVGQDIYAVTDRGLAVIRFADDGTPTVDISLDRRLKRPPGELKGIALQQNGKFHDGSASGSRIWLFGMTWLGWFPAGGGPLTIYDNDPMMIKEFQGGAMVYPDYRSGVYVGTKNELKYYNHNIGFWETIGISSGLPADCANGIFIDFEKNMWFATDRGVGKISSRRFASFQQLHGLLENEVAAILEYEPGKFILGHNRGITLFNGQEFTGVPFASRTSPSASVNRVLDINMDEQRNVWLALSWKGVGKINPEVSELTYFDSSHGVPKFVYSVFPDRDGSVWLAGRKGIYRRLPGQKRFERVPVPVPMSFSIRRLFGRNGRLAAIASSRNGVYLFDAQRRKWINHRLEGSSRSNSVYALFEEAEGRWLVGTASGAFVLDDTGKGNSNRFTPIDYLDNRPVYFIMKDLRGRYWFGTDNGVVRRDHSKNEVVRFTTAQGLMGQETNRAAGIMDHNGRIWVGTNRGLSVYDEAFDNTGQFQPKPKLHLLHLEIPDSRRVIPMSAGETVELSAEENTLVFHFRGISFSDETAIRFQSRLQGFEESWSRENYPYGQKVRYTNLSAGKYRFRLKVRNAMGVWSDEVISPEIVILKPIYLRWWFIVLAFLLAAGPFYLAVRLLAERKQSALLERLVEERTRQLEEAQQQLLQAQKMEAMGTLAGGIAHDFNNILGVITGYTEMLCDDLPAGGVEHRNAYEVLKAARRAAELVRQILAFSRKSERKHISLNVTPVIRESMRMMRATIPATIDIRQSYNALNDTVKADAAQMHQVIMNLVTNAAHAMKEKGGELEVALNEVHLDKMSLDGKNHLIPGPYLKLTVRDTGHGIPNVVLKRIFDPYFTTKETGEGTGLGLAMIHGIVKNHNGDVTVHSQPGNGTTFSVYLPLIPQQRRVPG